MQIVSNFDYLGMRLSNRNSFEEEVKMWLGSGNGSCHSAQTEPSRVLCQNVTIKIHQIMILPVVQHGSETWSLTVREEHKLRVFENRLLRRIFGPKRDGVTGGWRKLHNEELHNLYSPPSINRITKPRRMRWAGHVARMGEKRNVYRLLVGKPEGKRPLGGPRRR
jgi:hypothetical protein